MKSNTLYFSSSSNFKAYSADVPTFLQNLPKDVVKYCCEKLSAAGSFEKSDVVTNEDGFTVNSSGKIYNVSLGSDDENPFCSCPAFKANYLPCKHIFAVIRVNNMTWNDLSSMYRASHYLRLDTLTHEEPSTSSVPLSQETRENQKSFNQHQRDAISMLKTVESNVYLCEDSNILETVSKLLQEVNDKIIEGVKTEDGLKLELRKLPGSKKRKKPLASKRVGKKAEIVKRSLCTGMNYSPFTILWKLPFCLSPCSKTPTHKSDFVIPLHSRW